MVTDVSEELFIKNLHRVISQKTIIQILTAVKISNVSRLVKEFLVFYGPKRSLPFSQQSATEPYPEPYESLILFLF